MDKCEIGSEMAYLGLLLTLLFSVKAVADGAISFYIDHYVTARIARATYGISVNPILDGSKKDHKERMKAAYSSYSGRRKLCGAFSTILKKV